MLIFKHIVNSCIVIKYLKSLCRPEYQVSQPCECRNLFSMYALLSKILVEESKRYQYLKTEVKQSNGNGILPNSLNIAKLVLVLLAPSIYLQK